MHLSSFNSAISIPNCFLDHRICFFDMANVDVNFVESFRHQLGERDGILSYEEAIVQVSGQRLLGPQQKPLKSNRPKGDVCLIDLPIRDLHSHGGKLEQFVDIIQNHPVEGEISINADFLDNLLYKHAVQAKYSALPKPFCLKAEPKVPYSMQFVIVPSYLPPDEDQARLPSQEQDPQQ